MKQNLQLNHLQNPAPQSVYNKYPMKSSAPERRHLWSVVLLRRLCGAGFPTYANFYTIPKGHKKEIRSGTYAPKENAINNLGNWRVFTPDSNPPTIINNLYFTTLGNIKY